MFNEVSKVSKSQEEEEMEPRLLSYFHFNFGIFPIKSMPIAILSFLKMILIIILILIFILIMIIYCNSFQPNILTLQMVKGGTTVNAFTPMVAATGGSESARAWRATRHRMRIHQV